MSSLGRYEMHYTNRRRPEYLIGFPEVQKFHALLALSKPIAPYLVFSIPIMPILNKSKFFLQLDLSLNAHLA